MKGPLGPGVVPFVLKSIYLGRRTWMLRFIREAERRSVRFMSGHIVYGEASLKELRLGEVLVAAGRLDPAVRARADEIVGRERKRMGAVLREMGVLDENSLEEALALQVRAILASVFSLRDGTYTFQEQDPETFLDDDWPLAISTAEAVLAAVRAVSSEEDVRFALAEVDRVLLSSDDPLVLFQRMDLAPEESAVLSRVDGTRTARDVLAGAGLPATVAERSLMALLCTGVLEYGSDQPAAAEASTGDLRKEVLDLHAARDRPHHEVLGVPAGASPADVKAAYFRLAKRYHPDVRHQAGLTDLGPQLEAVFFRVNDAYRALTARPAPAASAPRSAGPSTELEYETMLRQGRELLKDGKSWDAAAVFEQVVEGASGRMRTRARVLLGRAHLLHPERERVAEKELLEAVKEDPAHVEAHYLLGTLYRRRGLSTRA